MAFHCTVTSPQALLNILHELSPADLARLACVSRALWAFANHDELVSLGLVNQVRCVAVFL